MTSLTAATIPTMWSLVIDMPAEEKESFAATWIKNLLPPEKIVELVESIQKYIAHQQDQMAMTEAYAKWKEWRKIKARREDWELRRRAGKLTRKERVWQKMEKSWGVLRKIFPWWNMTPEEAAKKEAEIELLWAKWSDKFAEERAGIDHSPVELIRKQRVHPFDFLQGVKFRIDAEAAEPKKGVGVEGLEVCSRIRDEIIMKALYESKHDVAKDLRGRLGAQILFSVFNGKQWTRDLGIGMLASFAWSVSAGAFFDLLAWVKVNNLLEKKKVKHTIKDVSELGLDSFSSFLVETGDSTIVGRIAGVMMGGKFFASLKVWMTTLFDALKSGLVAMFGSIANNYVIRFEKLFWFPIQMATTVLSTATSAAMVPIQLNNVRRNMVSALLLKIRDGFLPPLEEEELNNHGKMAKTLKMVPLKRDFKMLNKKLQARLIDNAANARLEFAIGIGKSTGMLIRSMGVGALISIMFGFVPTFPWTGKRKISKKMVNVLDLVVIQPTEVYSLNAIYLSANFIGNEKIQRFLSTDVNKYKQTVALILEKSKEQMKMNQKGHNHHDIVPIVPIDRRELSQIYHTWFGRFPYQLGWFITYTINFFVTRFGTTWYNKNEMRDANLVKGHYLLRLSSAEAIVLRDTYQRIVNEFVDVTSTPWNAHDVYTAIGHDLESFKTTLKSSPDGKMPSHELPTFYDKVWDGIRSVKQTLHEDENEKLRAVLLFRSMLELFNELGDQTVLKWSNTNFHKEYMRAKQAIQEWMNAKDGGETHHPRHSVPHSEHGKNAVVNTYQDIYAEYESKHVNGKIVVQLTDLLEQVNMEAEQKVGEQMYQNVPEEFAKNEL